MWLTKDALDDLILPNHEVHDVSSKMKKTVGFPLLSSCCLYPTLNNQGQTGRLQASFTCSKLDIHKKNWIIRNFADVGYCVARLATTCVAQCCRRICTGGESPGTSHGKQSHFFEFGFHLMNSNVSLDCCSSQLLIFLQLTARGGFSFPKKVIFFLFEIAVAHWLLPLGPICMCPKSYQYIKKKKSYFASLPSIVSFTHVTAKNSPRGECCLNFSTEYYTWPFLSLFFLLAGSYTLDYCCDGLEIESLNINNMSQGSWCFISHFSRFIVFVFLNRKNE